MILQRVIALAAMALAFALLVVSQYITGKTNPTLKKFLRYSGLVYLSVTVLLYLLVRYREGLPLEYVILAEAFALVIHLFTCGLLVFVEKKLSALKNNPENKSDVEPK